MPALWAEGALPGDRFREALDRRHVADTDSLVGGVRKRPVQERQMDRHGLLELVEGQRRHAEQRSEIREAAVRGEEPARARDDPRLDREVVLGPEEVLDGMDALVLRRPLA